MEKLGDHFRTNKEFVVQFIKERFGVDLAETEIFPASKYPEVAAKAEGRNAGRLALGVSKVVMRILENVIGAWIAGYGSVFYSQSPLVMSMSERDMFQILAHEFGHILTEKTVGVEWMKILSYELSDGFAEYVAWEALQERYPGNDDWHGERKNVDSFRRLVSERRLTSGPEILNLLKEQSESSNQDAPQSEETAASL